MRFMRFVRLMAPPRPVLLFLMLGMIGTGSVLPILAADFPFDRELLLQAPPMRPGKRLPVLNVMENGTARIDLWCRTIAARVQLSESAIKIEPAPLPDNPPEMQSAGQCTPERIDADVAFIAALAQVTGWQIERGDLVLTGPERLRFRASSN